MTQPGVAPPGVAPPDATGGQQLARNIVYNVLGQGLPLVVALFAIPVLVRELGPARFGMLSLAWTMIGYFSLFDLGLSRALTHALSVRMGAGARGELPAVTWTALLLMTLLGIVGGVLLATVSSPLVHSGLKVPPAIAQETADAFRLISVSLPFLVVTAGLRSILESHQDFQVATLLRVPFAIFTFGGPLAVLPFSHSLVPIVGMLVAGRIVTFVLHGVVCVQRYPFLRLVTVRRDLVRPLVRFGGWLTVTNVVSPLMTVLDRFLIGAFVSASAVAFYVTPQEIVNKLLIGPIALVQVLFPAVTQHAVQDPRRAAALVARGARALLVMMVLPALAIILFARELLTQWLGPGIAEPSVVVFQWLAVGLVFSALAQAPYAALQAVGRTDVIAKLHIVELPVYAVMIWGLAQGNGIAGVAMAWTLRIALDFGALTLLAARLAQTDARELLRVGAAAVGILSLLAGGAMVDDATQRLLVALGLAAGLALMAWHWLLLPEDRWAVRRASTRSPGADTAEPGSAAARAAALGLMRGPYLVRRVAPYLYLRGWDALLSLRTRRVRTRRAAPSSGPVRPGDLRTSELRRPPRVLLATGGHLGDVVIATSAIVRLARAIPGIEIGVLVPAWSEVVLRGHRALARIHVVEHWHLSRRRAPLWRKWLDHRRSAKRSLAQIVAAQYDAAVDLYPYYPNMARLLWHARIPVRIGYTSGGFGSLFTDPVPWSPDIGHIAVQQAALIDRLVGTAGGDPVAYALAPVPSDVVERTDALLARAGLDQEVFVVVHTGAGAPDREWPRDRWEEVIAWLLDHGHPVAVTGEGERDAARTAAIAAAHPGVVDLAGRLDWEAFVHTISRARLVISGETAAAHVAAAVGVPCVTLMSGTTITEHWLPLGAEDGVIRTPGASMDALSADDVLVVVRRMIDQRARIDCVRVGE